MPSEFKTGLEEIYSHGLTIKGLLHLEALLHGTNVTAISKRLRFSSDIRKRLLRCNRAIATYKGGRDKPNLYDTFKNAGNALYDVVLLIGDIKLIDMAERYESISSSVSMSSEHIQKVFGLKPGPELGAMIEELRKKEFVGMP